MTLNNILFHNTHLDIRAANNAIEINCRDLQGEPIRLMLQGAWKQANSDWRGSVRVLNHTGIYRFTRCR